MTTLQTTDRIITRHFFIVFYILLIIISGCHTVAPDLETGDIIDASQNVSSALYHPTIRVDNPHPIQSLAFIRHFYYIAQQSPWTIVSSGSALPSVAFEDIGVYILRFTGSGEPDVVRLARLPGLQTDGLSPSRVHLAIASRSETNIDGVLLIRNASDRAIAFVEDGPLYGPFSVEAPDTITVLDQPVRLLADTRVRAAALSFDGSRAAYADDRGRIFTVGTTIGDIRSDEIIDLRQLLGPSSVSSIQWMVGSSDVLLVRLERGLGPESWSVILSTRQLGPAGIAPGLIREPGSDQLGDVDLFTRNIPTGLWRVPAPERFGR